MANPYEGQPGRHAKDAKVQTIRATGAVQLFGPEVAIVDTPEFQRLGGIKQLGTSYFVFRGAVHTRFEHSLGTLQQAQNIIDAVNDNSAKAGRPDGSGAAGRIDRRGTRLARLGALLHDLPHVPFGHTLEDEFKILTRHDENAGRLKALLADSEIGALLREHLDEAELDDLLFLLDVPGHGRDKKGTRSKDEAYAERLGEYAYVADIVANTVCADVLDYIVRDLSACGMPVAIGTRFLDFFEITPGHLPLKANCHRLALRLDKRGMPRPDVESEVLKLLSYRYELAERVFFHHAKNAASVMIGEAVTLLGLDQRDENFHYLTDDGLLSALSNHKVALALGLRITKDEGRRAEAARIGEMIVRRRLYKLAYLGVSDDDVSLKAHDIYHRWGQSAEVRRELEAQLAAKAGLKAGRVLVHLLDPKMMAKLARVRVLLGDDTVTTYEEWEARHSERVQALNRAHARLWRVGVYMDPEDYCADDGAQRRLVQSAARDLFDLPSRYARTEIDEPYLATVYDMYAGEMGWSIGDRERHLRQAVAAAAKTKGSGSLQSTVELIDGVVKGGADPVAEQTTLGDQ